jgi:hypothetical protein
MLGGNHGDDGHFRFGPKVCLTSSPETVTTQSEQGLDIARMPHRQRWRV